MAKVIIIGGGAAGLLAGISAQINGATETTILEKMSRVGKKLLITGKGRCNITNNCTVQELIKNLPGNGRFLYGAFSKFNNQDMVKLLEDNGLTTKVERGGRVFPQSDKAQDVVDTLSKIFTKLGGKICVGKKVVAINTKAHCVVSVTCGDGSSYNCDAVVLTTGGASYPGTGSTGDGYKLAEAFGHSIIPLKPSLVPLECASDYIKELQGLSLKNVSAKIVANDKTIGEDFGEMLFTHFGVSGPIILSLSRFAALAINDANAKYLDLVIDLKPALSQEVLDARVQRDFAKYSRKQLVNALKDLLPNRLIPVIIDCACLRQEQAVNQITKEERTRLVIALKNFSMPITGTRPLSEAIVTSGGINTKEINPKNLASKIVNGLYIAGEVMDVDGFTGGYNLQAAFSSGYVAGAAAASEEG